MVVVLNVVRKKYRFDTGVYLNIATVFGDTSCTVFLFNHDNWTIKKRIDPLVNGIQFALLWEQILDIWDTTSRQKEFATK
jgi:hypothetical protein